MLTSMKKKEQNKNKINKQTNNLKENVITQVAHPSFNVILQDYYIRQFAAFFFFFFFFF